jgi:hypothetical protein
MLFDSPSLTESSGRNRLKRRDSRYSIQGVAIVGFKHGRHEHNHRVRFATLQIDQEWENPYQASPGVAQNGQSLTQ